ncbi:MAG: SRPBCC family protein [Gaiellaceae bacterium]
MVELRKTIEIDASPERVWDVLGDLAATAEWLPGTVSARMDGSRRICTTLDGFDIEEEISDYAPDRHSYRFRHVELPLPVQNSNGVFRVEPRDGGSLVVLENRFEALDPAQEDEVAAMFGGALEQAVKALKRWVEEGRRWDEQ